MRKVLFALLILSVSMPALAEINVALVFATAGWGAYLSQGQLNWFSMNKSAGRGYMALAATVFGGWNPLGAFGASYLFAFTDAVQMRMQALNLVITSQIIQMVPYLLTILVLAGAMIKSRPPAGLGKHY